MSYKLEELSKFQPPEWEGNSRHSWSSFTPCPSKKVLESCVPGSGSLPSLSHLTSGVKRRKRRHVTKAGSRWQVSGNRPANPGHPPFLAPGSEGKRGPGEIVAIRRDQSQAGTVRGQCSGSRQGQGSLGSELWELWEGQSMGWCHAGESKPPFSSPPPPSPVMVDRLGRAC